jgi:hypothetical protein
MLHMVQFHIHGSLELHSAGLQPRGVRPVRGTHTGRHARAMRRAHSAHNQRRHSHAKRAPIQSPTGTAGTAVAPEPSSRQTPRQRRRRPMLRAPPPCNAMRLRGGLSSFSLAQAQTAGRVRGEGRPICAATRGRRISESALDSGQVWAQRVRARASAPVGRALSPQLAAFWPLMPISLGEESADPSCRPWIGQRLQAAIRYLSSVN